MVELSRPASGVLKPNQVWLISLQYFWTFWLTRAVSLSTKSSSCCSQQGLSFFLRPLKKMLNQNSSVCPHGVFKCYSLNEEKHILLAQIFELSFMIYSFLRRMSLTEKAVKEFNFNFSVLFVHMAPHHFIVNKSLEYVSVIQSGVFTCHCMFALSLVWFCKKIVCMQTVALVVPRVQCYSDRHQNRQDWVCLIQNVY